MPSPPRRIEPGVMLGRYQLVTRIARGGMGEVWLATASGSGGFAKRVVIKTVLPDRAHDPSFVELLSREARLCGSLNHPNLIEVFDFFDDGGVYGIAMEYVVGRSLSQIVRASKASGAPIPPWAALRMIWEACHGLECAHEAGIIHCDLSPGNIMLSFAGLTKVLDFGVASTADVRGERLKGKYHYMAPERVSEVISDRRTDVYALGVIMYVLFTGRLPISAPSDEALLWSIVNERPKPPSAHRPIDADIEAVILRAMAPDPAVRYQDAGSLLQAISRCRDGQPGACSQLDMARFLGSVFPDAPELPAHVRASLSPEQVEVDETERALSLLAYGSAELEDFEISIDVVNDAPPQRAASVRELFEAAPSRRSHSGVFDTSPGLGEGTRRGATTGVFDGATPPPPSPPSPARGAFGDLPAKDDEAWPWARSLIKPS